MKAAVQKIFEQGLTKVQAEYIVRTLKDISRNSSYQTRKECNEYPTQSLMTAIDFDHIKTIYVNTLERTEGGKYAFRSCDALYPTDSGEWFFIEFKDGMVDSKVVKEVYEKIEDSKNILMDLGILENGYLQVDDMKSVLIPVKSGEDEFAFNSRMQTMKYVNQLDYFRNHFFFILVYNERLYKETEQDKDGYRDGLKRGEYDSEIDFLSKSSYVLGKESVEEFLERVINEGHFRNLVKMIERASNLSGEEDKKLINHFDKVIADREELVKRCGAVKGKFGDKAKMNALSGEEFLRALFIFSIYNDNVSKELDKLIHIISLENDEYNDFIEKLKKYSVLLDIEEVTDYNKYVKNLILKGGFEEIYSMVMKADSVYVKKIIAALAKNAKVPERLFYIHRYEGKYFKGVFTYSEEEFEKYFVQRYANEEKNDSMEG